MSVVWRSIGHSPDFDPSRAVVLFPSDDALDVADLEPGSIDRAFIIDSKWWVIGERGVGSAASCSCVPDHVLLNTCC